MTLISPATLDQGMAMRTLVRSQSVPGQVPGEAVRVALAGSKASHVVTVGGRPLALYGIATPSPLSGTAYLWAILSEEIAHHRITIGRISKKVVRAAQSEYDTIITTTQPGFELADRWVRWLGFEQVESIHPGALTYAWRRN